MRELQGSRPASSGAAWRGVRPLWWLLLLASGLLSALSLRWPAGGLDPAAGPASAAVEWAPARVGAAPMAAAAAPGLPAVWPKARWPEVVRDPFAASVQAVRDEPVPPEPEPTPSGPSPEPPPAVQPAVPDYRFLGSLVDLEGQTRVFVTHAAQHLELQAGQALPDEHVVESVGPPAIRLRHAQGLAVVEIPWPSSAEPVR